MAYRLRWKYSRWILLALINIAYFSLINPIESTSLVLFGGFLLLGLDVFLVFRLFLLLLASLRRKPLALQGRIAALGTLVTIILLALQSIGQLSLRDAAVVLSAGVIILFYSSYYRPRHPS